MKRAEELGAKPVIPVTALPEGGELAVMHDPHGMRLASGGRSETARSSTLCPQRQEMWRNCDEQAR